MRKNKNKLWFKAKTYGWGWQPATWEGWLVLVLYLVLVIGSYLYLDNKYETQEALIKFLPLVGIYVFALIAICYRTGEKPRWSWGKKKK